LKCSIKITYINTALVGVVVVLSYRSTRTTEEEEEKKMRGLSLLRRGCWCGGVLLLFKLLKNILKIIYEIITFYRNK
jgi:hypothetical protein